MEIDAMPYQGNVLRLLGKRLAAAVVRRAQAWSARVDAAPPRFHSRMGAWEQITSPKAQAALYLVRQRTTGEPDTAQNHEA